MYEQEKTVAVNPSAPTAGEQPSETLTTNIIPQANPNFNEKKKSEKKIFTTIDGGTLMSLEFEPMQFAIEKILPHGLFIMAGSGKIGKSWLSLEIAAAVASGGMLWEFNAEHGEALYLALEDNYPRLQSRLKIMESESADITRLHLATASHGIANGLIEQTHNFLAEHPDTRLIIIDTLECIRDTGYDKNMYSCDYRDMTKLREITDRHNLTLLLIHHTRKMFDPDPLNTLSGSTGLVGSVDGIFVLEKETRTGNKGKLTIANRDTEGYCFKLEFDPEKCKWLLIEKNAAESEAEENICVLIDDFLQESWQGTPTQLCGEGKKLDGNSGFTPSTITKELKNNTGLFKKKYGIEITFDRKRDGRLITLMRVPCENE